MTIPAVSHYMSKQPWTVSRFATLEDAHRMMREHHVRHLPVVEAGNLVGIVSLCDLHMLETAAESPLDGVRVEDAMTKQPFVVSGDVALDEVADIMAEHPYGSAVVMGRDGVEGIFTTVDAFRTLAEILRRDSDACHAADASSGR